MKSYSTVGQVASWVASAAQKSWTVQREEVLDTINKVRRMFYNLYAEIPLEIDVEEVFCVQRFYSGSEDYNGVTLPAYMQGAEAIWRCGKPVSMFTKWREVHTGLRGSYEGSVQSYDLPGGSPVELDFSPIGVMDTVGVIATCQEDCGKEVIIRGMTDGGVKEFALPLNATVWTTTPESMYRIVQAGVVLPTDLRGGVILRQTNDCRIISEYIPGEHVPNYTRLKLTGVEAGDYVVIRASRRFLPVYFDTDIVETDNQLAWEEGARFFRYNDNGTDRDLALKADRHLAMFRSHILGEKSRDIGKAKEDPVLFTHRPKRSRLRGRSWNG